MQRMLDALPVSERSDRSIARQLGIHHATVKTIREGTGNRVAGSTLRTLEEWLRHQDPDVDLIEAHEDRTAEEAIFDFRRDADSLKQVVSATAHLAKDEPNISRTLWSLYERTTLDEPDHSDQNARDLFARKLRALLGVK